MNPATFALNNRIIIIVVTIMLIFGGIISYQKLGRLANPNFTMKIAMIITHYPGAGPDEVEQEVTDLLEDAIQSMGQIKKITSTSVAGDSYILVEMKDKYTMHELPQVWDELRRKVGDVQGQLPVGAGHSIVNDDFGDVYGVYFAITGDGYSYAQLKEYIKTLKKELLLCKDVAKIDFWGIQDEAIYIEFDRAKLTELGLSPEMIYGTIGAQNQIVPSGKIEIDDKYIRISPTGELNSEKVIGDIMLAGAEGMIRLGDIAKIKRGYKDPPRNLIRYNGNPAIGFGISTIKGGNVVVMGNSIKKRLEELKSQQPVGIELHKVYYQSERVTKAISDFTLNFIEAVIIVIILLMLFMGWQSGLLIGFILLLTILGTYIGMLLMDINLQRISLGALILALGMLVDNAIVVADGILVKVERGESRDEAAQEIVKDTQWPLLGATMIAILAFAAIGFAPGNVGEFCRSLFYVLAMSLFLSWVLAVTVTPLLCVWFLKIPENGQEVDPYGKPMFKAYKKLVAFVMRYHWITIGSAAALLIGAIFLFSTLPSSMFTNSNEAKFFIDYWLPQGTYIKTTSRKLQEIEKYISKRKGIESVTSFIGSGTLRFVLAYEYENPNTSYGQMVIEVDDYHKVPEYMYEIEKDLQIKYPDIKIFPHFFSDGPPNLYKVEARFRGPDKKILAKLAVQAIDIFKSTKNVKNIMTDWRQEVRVIKPEYSDVQARRVGVNRNDLSKTLQWACNGIKIGNFREKDEALPIISWPSDDERGLIDNLDNITVWSPLNKSYVPLQQVIKDINVKWEWPIIKRRNRKPTITVKCNPIVGVADSFRKKIKNKIENIQLPPGYNLEWGGEFESSRDAQTPLKKSFPLCVLGMFLIIVFLFNSFREPIIIMLVVPLSIIGVAIGLWIFNLSFSFMAILGFLGLAGMLIKNAIILIDQINLDLSAGKSQYHAVLDSAVSRLRPVTMAAGTTILGMLPLVTDPFYANMAVTIMGGLCAATFLTLLLVPVLYSIFYSVKAEI